MEPSVICVSTSAILRELDRQGRNSEVLLREMALNRQQLEAAGARIPIRQQERLWCRAQRVAKDPLLALKAADEVQLGIYGAVDHVACLAGSVGEALGRVAQYSSEFRDDATLEVIAGNEVAFRLAPRPGHGVPSVRYAEYCFALGIARSRRVSDALRPRRVEFACSPHPDPTSVEHWFGCPVRYHSPYHQLVFTRSEWDRRIVLPNLDQPTTVAAAISAKLVPGVTGNLEELLTSLPLDGATLEQAAKTLGLHPRSVQRRLKSEGVRFADVARQVKRYRAEALLANPDLSMHQVSELLGYSEQSAFCRAFRKLTGCTPSEYRKRLGLSRAP